MASYVEYLLYLFIFNISLIRSLYDETCGCSIWMCDNYQYNTSEYESCVASDGCIYCSKCQESMISECQLNCDMESICDDTTNTNSSSSSSKSSSTKWWLIAGFSIGILCCMFILVIVTYIYKITKDDHELAMIKMQRQNSRTERLQNAYSNSVTSQRRQQTQQEPKQKSSPKQNKPDPVELNRVTTQSETVKSGGHLEVDDDVVVHTIKISVDSPKEYSNNNNDDANSNNMMTFDDIDDESDSTPKERPKNHRFDSV